jgi:hypothetical protein
VTASGFEQIQGADRVGIEVREWDVGGLVVGRLSSRVHDRIGLKFFKALKHVVATPNVQFHMLKFIVSLLKALLVPACVPVRTEKLGTSIIVNAVDRPASPAKVVNHLRTDQPGRSRYEQLASHEVKLIEFTY